jgi:hypothetical protein
MGHEQSNLMNTFDIIKFITCFLFKIYTLFMTHEQIDATEQL